MTQTHSFQPLLFGGDINVYSVARANPFNLIFKGFNTILAWYFLTFSDVEP